MNPSGIFFFSAGEKKRRRKSRWSSGIYVKKRLVSSPQAREDAEGGTKGQTLMDLELVSTPADKSHVREGGEERWVESSYAAEGEAGTNSNRQHKRDDMDIGVAGKQTDRAGNGNSEAISVENHEGRHTRMEIETSSHGKFVQNETQKLKATGSKIVTVAEKAPAKMATPRTMREDLNTGEMVSSQGSHDAVHR